MIPDNTSLEAQAHTLNTPGAEPLYYSEFLFVEFYLSGNISVIECHSKLQIHTEGHFAILFKSLYFQQHEYSTMYKVWVSGTLLGNSRL